MSIYPSTDTPMSIYPSTDTPMSIYPSTDTPMSCQNVSPSAYSASLYCNSALRVRKDCNNLTEGSLLSVHTRNSFSLSTHGFCPQPEGNISISFSCHCQVIGKPLPILLLPLWYQHFKVVVLRSDGLVLGLVHVSIDVYSLY